MNLARSLYTLAVRSAETIGAGVSATDDDDMLATRRNAGYDYVPFLHPICHR